MNTNQYSIENMNIKDTEGSVQIVEGYLIGSRLALANTIIREHKAWLDCYKR